MLRRRAAILLFLLALAVRLAGVSWDRGTLFHPDERRIAEAVGELSLSPPDLDPGFYAYGSFPLLLTRLAQGAASPLVPGAAGFREAVLTGRVLSALWGALGVVVLFLLGRRLFGERVGGRAALFLALAVLPVQNARFATNDVALATLVTLVLALLAAAVEGGSVSLFAWAGGAFGLALATKASAAPAALAALAALGFLARRRGLARTVSAGAAFGGAALLTFALGQPTAFTKGAELLRAVAEQGAMVRAPGLVPYTIQYVGTLPYLYPLKEMVLWGMGPLLGLAAVWGTGRALRLFRTPGVAILLAFLVPFLLVTGAFGVKFPRYLLPAYPLLLLFAAAALEEIAGRAGRLVRGAVLAGSAAYLLAFLTISTRDHTVRSASRWAYEHLAPGSRILTTTWEEGFPVPLPGSDPGRFDVEPFPFYDPDSAPKMRALAEALARADAVAFPTKRIYGAILADEVRFPDSARFFRLLFAGDLGFRLAASVGSRPGLLGVELPDELADESFSVYDHPRALVFTRGAGARPTADEIAYRIAAFTPGRVLTRRDILLGAPPRFASRALPDSAVRSSLLAAALLALLAAALSIPGSALARRAFGEAPGVHALGAPLGVALFAWLAFLAASAGIPFTRPLLLALAALLVAGGLLLRRRLPPLAPRERWAAAGVLWGGFLLFLAFRAFAPEIFWGEKPMDFSFLGVLARSESLPPPEPWFAGSALHYTYLGHFTVAALGKALGIAPGILFNLGIALGAGLFACALLFAGAACGGTLRAGAGAVLLGLLAGNLAGPLQLLRRPSLDFDHFWAVSRVVPGAINEFPFWSYLFADLHAHVLALPLAAAALGALLHANAREARPAALAAAALLLGALAATNGWSVPTFAALTLLLALLGAWRSEGTAWRRAGRALRHALLPALGAWAAFSPFWSAYRGPARQWGWNRDELARPHEALIVFGLFLALLLPWIGRALRGLGTTRLAAAGLGGVLVFLALVDLPALLAGTFREAGSVRALAAALAVLLAVRSFSAEAEPERRAALLAAAAFAIVLGCELVTLWDRMNTVFKFWLDAWLILAIACGALAAEVLAAPRRRPLAASLLVAALATSALAATAWARSRHVPGPRGTLDGTAYLAGKDPDEAAALAWLNRNVPGLPTVAEAFGPSYQGTARVAMHTGLPIVLGWEYHLVQRGQSWEAIGERRDDLARLFRGAEPRDAARVLSRWRVAWVFCGREEEKAYGPGVRGRLERLAPLLAPAFRSGDVTIFRVALPAPG